MCVGINGLFEGKNSKCEYADEGLILFKAIKFYKCQKEQP